MSKTRKKFDREFKKRIVSEYIAGNCSAQELADREGIERFQIYSWKSQIEASSRQDRVEELSRAGHDPQDIRRMLELEDELDAAKQKIAELTLLNDLLKKRHPSFQSEKESSGYAELKRKVSPLKGRAK